MEKKIISEIKKSKAKNILLQFPDGLKPKATKIAKKIEKKAKINVFIWLNSCYGSCDIPVLGKLKKNIDIVFSFGHSLWPFKRKIKAMEID